MDAITDLSDLTARIVIANGSFSHPVNVAMDEHNGAPGNFYDWRVEICDRQFKIRPDRERHRISIVDSAEAAHIWNCRVYRKRMWSSKERSGSGAESIVVAWELSYTQEQMHIKRIFPGVSAMACSESLRVWPGRPARSLPIIVRSNVELAEVRDSISAKRNEFQSLALSRVGKPASPVRRGDSG